MSSLEDRSCASNFKIKIDENDAAKRCHLKGHYTIHISNTSIGLLDSKKNVVYCWPYIYIRRYGVENNNNVFVIEAGRRCDSGEGQFRFQTRKAKEINSLLQDHLTRMQISYNPVVIVGPSNSQQVAKQKGSGISEESDKRPQLPKVNQSTAYSSSRDGTHNLQGGTKAKKPQKQLRSEQLKLGKTVGPLVYPEEKKEEESEYTEIDQDDDYEIVK
ncbi:hypothetical protein CHS0354_041117 [Potamilus streckersoni]|uniref:IRS-type PTB domain-containing protein n=1 Tax=Potamilus streckersoni TaxID=2493646 RepID=A0AAE0SE91_9BIVA|nr:hypothetical protein CHS0354_041117 [Potamilus streckersoni]